MKRYSILLLLSILVIGCQSRAPSGFSSLSPVDKSQSKPDSLNVYTKTHSDVIDVRPSGFGNLPQRIREGNIPTEAILATVYFDFDRYSVSASERGKIDLIAERARNTQLIIVGYTDHFGTEEYNLGLSDRRAQSVRDYLVGLGVNQKNTEIMALGSQHANKEASGRQTAAKDRKAIVVDVNYAGPTSTSGASRPSVINSVPSADGSAPPPVNAL